MQRVLIVARMHVPLECRFAAHRLRLGTDHHRPLVDTLNRRCHAGMSVRQDVVMKKNQSLYHSPPFPAALISSAVRWYHRFQLSLRDIEELLLERGVTLTYEMIRRWCEKFGADFAPGSRPPVASRAPRGIWMKCM